MSTHPVRRQLAKELATAAAAYQVAAVIPHCAQCAKPCCRLDTLVLELEWSQLKPLWQLRESRAAFDRRLASGKGPTEIRPADGLYYSHQKACPAYDEARRSCRAYDQEFKPTGCTDFPVYEDQRSIIADLRCEAVDIAALTTWIANAVGKAFRVVQTADETFPFLVTLSVRKISGATSAGNRPHRKE